MCGGGRPKAVKQEDPAVTQARIEAEAQKKANAKAAERKRNNRGSLLVTGAGFNQENNQTFG